MQYTKIKRENGPLYTRAKQNKIITKTPLLLINTNINYTNRENPEEDSDKEVGNCPTMQLRIGCSVMFRQTHNLRMVLISLNYGVN